MVLADHTLGLLLSFFFNRMELSLTEGAKKKTRLETCIEFGKIPVCLTDRQFYVPRIDLHIPAILSHHG
jgi:hypothetical protein